MLGLGSGGEKNGCRSGCCSHIRFNFQADIQCCVHDYVCCSEFAGFDKLELNVSALPWHWHNTVSMECRLNSTQASVNLFSCLFQQTQTWWAVTHAWPLLTHTQFSFSDLNTDNLPQGVARTFSTACCLHPPSKHHHARSWPCRLGMRYLAWIGSG